MNIVNLSIANLGASCTPANPTEPSTPQSNPGNAFDSFLSGIIAQTIGDTDSDARSATGQHRPISEQGTPTAGLTQEELLSLIEGQTDLFATLGRTLLELVVGVQNGETLELKGKEFEQALGKTLRDLGAGGTGAHPAMVHLLAHLKQATADGMLAGIFGATADALPDATKLKLKLHTQSLPSTAAEQSLQTKLMVHVLSNLASSAGGAAGHVAGDATGAARATHLHEIVRFDGRIPVTNAGDATVGTAIAEGATSGKETLSAVSLTRQTPEPAGPGAEQPTQPVPDQTGEQALANISKQGVDADLAVSPAEAQALDDAAAVRLTEAPATPHEGDVKQQQREPGLAMRQMPGDGDAPPGAPDDEGAATTAADAAGEAHPHPIEATQRSHGGMRAFATQATGRLDGAMPSAGADPDNVVAQIVEKFEVLLSGGKHEARIQLKPEHLGEVRVHLVMENGAMRAVLDAATPQVKELLEANLQHLKQSLESQGLQVRQFDVSVGQHFEGRGRGFSQQRLHQHGHSQHEDTDALQIQRARLALSLQGAVAVDYLA